MLPVTNFDEIEDHDGRSISRKRSVKVTSSGGIIRIDNRNYSAFNRRIRNHEI